MTLVGSEWLSISFPRGSRDARRVCSKKNRQPGTHKGNPAVSGRPVVFRPHLAMGLVFSLSSCSQNVRCSLSNDRAYRGAKG